VKKKCIVRSDETAIIRRHRICRRKFGNARVHRINIASCDSSDVPTNGNPRADCSGKFLDSAQPSIFRPSVAVEAAPHPRSVSPGFSASVGPPFSVRLSRSIDTFFVCRGFCHAFVKLSVVTLRLGEVFVLARIAFLIFAALGREERKLRFRMY